MLVEPDGGIMDLLVDALVRQLECQITCVTRVEDALDVEMLEPHDLVIAAMEAPASREDHSIALLDEPGLSSADPIASMTSLSRRPVILTCSEIAAETALRALQFGIRDVFVKPFPLLTLVRAAQAALLGYTMQREHAQRHARMRGLIRRLLRERREMRRRMELVCKDLVGAHRRLVRRVLAAEERLAHE